MKPTQKNNDSRKFPLVDCNYHSVTMDSCGKRCLSVPSFRSISRDYFDNEAPRNFATEAALFGTMVITAAVPIVSGVYAIIELGRAFAF